jgi:hypothetical protein
VHGLHSARGPGLPVWPSRRNGRPAHAQGMRRGAVTTSGTRARGAFTGGAQSEIRAPALSGRHGEQGGVVGSSPTGQGSVKAELRSDVMVALRCTLAPGIESCSTREERGS